MPDIMRYPEETNIPEQLRKMSETMPASGNILLVANFESDTGYAWWLMDNFWLTISDYFSTRGLDSYLIYPKITRIPDSIRESRIHTLEHDFWNRSPANLRRLHCIIREHNIKYIYLTDAPSHSVFYIMLKLWRIRLVIIHDHTPGDRTPPTRIKKILKTLVQRIPYYTADHFIAVSRFVYRRFLDIACIPADKCSCAPNGITPIELLGINPRYAHEAFGIPDDRMLVVTTGRASYYKGIDFYIECANELINHQGNTLLHFLYCGDGPDIDSFRSLVHDHKLEAYFTFTGNRSDIRQILPSCQIGFHASLGEVGYSLSILEYMSAGLVTIVPDLPSTSQAIRHMENGILYRSRNLGSATAAITLAAENSRHAYLGNNAKNTVQNEYNIADTNRRLIDILGPLLTAAEYPDHSYR